MPGTELAGGSTPPADAVLVRLPYSEVCCYMRVADVRMWVRPLPHGMAQLLREDGSNFSAPITRGEAGLNYDTAAEVVA